MMSRNGAEYMNRYLHGNIYMKWEWKSVRMKINEKNLVMKKESN